MDNKTSASNLPYLTIQECPLCGSDAIGHRYRIDRYDPPFDISLCKACEFMFMNPRPADPALEGLYGEGYYSGTADYSYYDERESGRFSRFVWERRLQMIRRFVPGGNILDVGSSFGGFLKTAAPFFTPHGIELSSYAGGHSKSSLRARIHIGTLDDHPFPENYFSVITMIELLEHLPSPAFALAECYRLLRDNGLLLIQTANMAGLQARIFGRNYSYFMPGHLSYFTKKNLTACLKQLGFRRIIVYYPVEFGLLPKLRKSRQTFSSPLDYRRWARITAYHYLSKIHCGDFAMTSSMVIYAIK